MPFLALVLDLARERVCQPARLAFALTGVMFALFGVPSQADELKLAVAANFAAPMEKIAAAFAQETGHKAVVVLGATGNLYTQIKSGAPFEVLLAADAAIPKKMEDEGLTVAGQRFTYAVGKLVLYSAKPGLVDAAGQILRSATYRHLAIANPKTAPYGAAAMETLQALGLAQALQGRIVQGDSIAQTFQFVSSGNAELGFVALSQLGPQGREIAGSWWVVPEKLHSPIRQDAVLLQSARQHPAALAFMSYLKSEKARALIRSYGYELP